MNPRARLLLQHLDRVQRHTGPLAFAYAVNKKFGDDQGGNLAALLTYYGFLSLFPLLLLLVTMLGLLVGPHSTLAHRFIHVATSQFPVLGDHLTIGQLHHDSAFGLVFGIVGLVWGTVGSVQNGQYAMAQVWNIPQVQRPGPVARLLRSLIVLALMVVFVGASSALAGVATFAGHRPGVFRGLSVLVSLVVDAGFMLGVFRALTPAQIPTRQLRPGAVAAGVAWAVLELSGTFLVDRELRNLSSVYGTFAVVLGLLWWIFLLIRVVLYSAEVNVVWARHLWPRGLAPPPLTAADREMLVTYAEQERRRPEVTVTAKVDRHQASGPERPPGPPPDGAGGTAGTTTGGSAPAAGG